MVCIYCVYRVICLDVRNMLLKTTLFQFIPLFQQIRFALTQTKPSIHALAGLFKFIMTGHGRHTLHFVLNERCLVRPTWLESRWIQWDQRAGVHGCSLQRPIGPPTPTTIHVLVLKLHKPHGATFSPQMWGAASRWDLQNTPGSMQNTWLHVLLPKAVPAQGSRAGKGSTARGCAAPGSYQYSVQIIVRLPWANTGRCSPYAGGLYSHIGNPISSPRVSWEDVCTFVAAGWIIDEKSGLF